MNAENKETLNVDLEKSIDRIRSVQSRIEYDNVSPALMRHHLYHAITSLQNALETLHSMDSDKVGA